MSKIQLLSDEKLNQLAGIALTEQRNRIERTVFRGAEDHAHVICHADCVYGAYQIDNLPPQRIIFDGWASSIGAKLWTLISALKFISGENDLIPYHKQSVIVHMNFLPDHLSLIRGEVGERQKYMPAPAKRAAEILEGIYSNSTVTLYDINFVPSPLLFFIADSWIDQVRSKKVRVE